MAAGSRLLMLTAVLCIVAVMIEAAAPVTDKGTLSIRKERNLVKGVTPFQGKGHKYTRTLVINTKTNTLATGSAGRSKTWTDLFSRVSIDVKNIQVVADKFALPASIDALINKGVVSASIANDTVVAVNGNKSQSCIDMFPIKCTSLPSRSSTNDPVMTTTQGVSASFERARVLRDERIGHSHVVEMSTNTGTCGVTANFSITPDQTVFSLLFNNFAVETNNSIVQQSTNCAFRVPILVPTGLTVAQLTSRLRGYAQSSAQGTASIAWTAGIGAGMPVEAWADIYTEDSYSARYWSGGVNSLQTGDFDPISVNMELDSQNPTFSPCGSSVAAQNDMYNVPVDFQFALTAIRGGSELGVTNYCQLDSQDTGKKITVNLPTDFEECDI